jgi:hypothetical protein
MDIKPKRNKQLRQGAEESGRPVSVQRYLLVTQEPNRLGKTALGLSVKVVVEDGFINVDKTEIYAAPPSREWIRSRRPFPEVVLVNTDLYLGTDEHGYGSYIWRSKLDVESISYHWSNTKHQWFEFRNSNVSDALDAADSEVLNTRGPWQFERTKDREARHCTTPFITGLELAAAAVSVYDQPHSHGLVQLPRSLRGRLADLALVRRQFTPCVMRTIQAELDYCWSHASVVERSELKAYRNARSSTRRQTDFGGL